MRFFYCPSRYLCKCSTFKMPEWLGISDMSSISHTLAKWELSFQRFGSTHTTTFPDLMMVAVCYSYHHQHEEGSAVFARRSYFTMTIRPKYERYRVAGNGSCMLPKCWIDNFHLASVYEILNTCQVVHLTQSHYTASGLSITLTYIPAIVGRQPRSGHSTC